MNKTQRTKIILDNPISSAFIEATKDSGHAWERDINTLVVRCTKCKRPSTQWKMKCEMPVERVLP